MVGLESVIEVGGAVSIARVLITLLAFFVALILPGLPLALRAIEKAPIYVVLIFAAGLGLAINGLLLLFLSLAGIPFSLQSLAIAYGAAAAVTFWEVRRRLRSGPSRDVPAGPSSWWPLSLLALFLGVLLLRWLSFGASPTILGVDTSHHVVVTDLILLNQGLPSGYEPYAPLSTFSYHFGFHANAAALATFAELPPHESVQLLGLYLVALVPLSVFVLTSALFRSEPAGLVAGAVIGFVSFFPAFFLNWGRYTQLMGVAIIPLALALLLRARDREVPRPVLLASSILVAGLFLIHYVMFLLFLYAVLALVVAQLVETRSPRETRALLRPLATVFGLALLLALPWVIHILASHLAPFLLDPPSTSPSVFSLARVGEPLVHPASLWVSILSLVGLGLLAVWRRFVFVFFVVWIAVSFLLSDPRYVPVPLAGILNTPTWAMTMLVFASPLIAYIPVLALSFLKERPRLRTGIWAGVVTAVVLLGTIATGIISTEGYETVRPADLRAFQWIGDNVPEDSVFATNVRIDPVFGSIQPLDAGIWITYFTGRKQLAPLLIYGLEERSVPDYEEQLQELAIHERRVGSFGAFLFLRDVGATHVYLGAKGTGPMEVNNLTRSPWYSVLYEDGNVTVAALEDLVQFEPLVLRPAYDWSFLSEGYPAERKWGVDGVVLEMYTFEEFKADYPIYLRETGRYRISIRLMDFPQNDFDTDEPLSGLLFELDGEPMLEHTYGTFTPIWLTLEVPFEGPGLHTLTIRSRDPGLPFRISLGDIVISQVEGG